MKLTNEQLFDLLSPRAGGGKYLSVELARNFIKKEEEPTRLHAPCARGRPV